MGFMHDECYRFLVVSSLEVYDPVNDQYLLLDGSELAI